MFLKLVDQTQQGSQQQTKHVEQQSVDTPTHMLTSVNVVQTCTETLLYAHNVNTHISYIYIYIYIHV